MKVLFGIRGGEGVNELELWRKFDDSCNRLDIAILSGAWDEVKRLEDEIESLGDELEKVAEEGR